MLLLTEQPIRPENQDTMDELLQDLRPIIHYVALFIRLTQWKDTKYSLLLFLSLIIWWQLHIYILCLLPVVFILIKFQYNILTSNNNSHKPQQQQQQQQQQQKDLIKDLTEIRNTLYLISSVKNWIQESDTLCRAYYQYYSISTSRKRYLILFGVTSLCAVVYVAWISLFYQQMITGASSLLWFFILITMCLYSPWVYPIYVASVRVVSPLIHTLQQVTLEGEDDREDELENEYVHGYCFEIYHHQRWWIPTGWCNLLLPQDLPLWSDVYLQQTPSIHRFQLPPTTYLDKLNSKNQQKVISWAWMDPHWTIQKDGTDKEGWQYGNWNWRSWSSQSGGIINCTRRQKWARYAQRKEYWVDVESCCSSLIGGSTTDSDSVYNWDQSGTSRSSSIF